MTGSVKRWGNRMPCEVFEWLSDGMVRHRVPCRVPTVFTAPDESGVQRRICRAHIEEQREAATV